MPLDSTGLTIRRFDEILTQLIDDEKLLVHPNIDDRDDELLGQINTLVAYLSSNLESTLQAVVDNLDPALAEGIWLDKLAAERGIRRIEASKSYTNYQKFKGTNGLNIPAGIRIQNTETGDTYQTVSNLQISTDNCIEVVFSVNTVLNSTTYTVLVNNVVCSYASDASATEAEILSGLMSAINTSVGSVCTASVSGSTLIIVLDDMQALPLKVSSISYLTVASATIRGRIECTVTGDKKASVGSISNIVTPITGLTSSTNIYEVVRGRLIEMDEELRSRMSSTSQSRGVATYPAILSALRSLDGVVTVSLYENSSSTTDANGVPPYTITAVVVGGEDEDIAKKIWDTKSVTVNTAGNTSYTFVDDENVNRTMYFTRPTASYIAVKVTYNTYSEEALTVGISDVIKETVVDYVNSLKIGEDIIPARFLGYLYSNTTGVNLYTVEIQSIASPGTPPSGGSWQTTKLAVGISQYPQTTLVDITVVAT